MLEGLFDRSFDFLAGVLTAPLAAFFLLIVTITYLGISQSSAFRSWFISLLTRSDLVEAYIDIVRRAVTKAKKTFYYSPVGVVNGAETRPRYTRFLALALAYATIWYIIAWSLGANLSIGTLSILPADRAEDRVALLWMVGLLTVIVVIVTSKPGEFDRSICIALGDSIGSADKESSDYLLFWRPFRPYKNKLGFAASIIIFLALITLLEPWLVTWTVYPKELLVIKARVIGLLNDSMALGQIGLCIIVAIAVGLAVASIGHAFVAFTYVCAAALALIINLPVHIAVPPMVAAAAFYRVQTPLILTIFAVPLLLFALTTIYSNLHGLEIEQYKLFFAIILSLPIVAYVAILEEPIFLPGWSGKILVGLLASIPFSAALLLRDTDFTPDHAKAIFVFWLVFPAVNAAFDLISWRSGIRNGERLLASADVQIGFQKKWISDAKHGNLQNSQVLLFAFYWGGRALAQALLVVLLFSIFVPFVLIIVNLIHSGFGFNVVIDPRSFTDALLHDPFSKDVVWVTAMLLTPLVPSALNFGIAFFLILLIPFSLLRAGLFSQKVGATDDHLKSDDAIPEPQNLLPLSVGFLAVLFVDLLLLRLILLASDSLIWAASAWISYCLQWPSLLLATIGLG